MAPSDSSNSRWATTVVLGDGSTAFIRPLVPSDQDDLLAFHQRQSHESVYRRYFSPKPSLSATELKHFTTVNMIDRAALTVEIHDEFVGWCSYERWPGRDEAEAAFMVDDAYYGLGIATLMLEHLAAIARTNGIERFTAEVLSDNRGMLAVFAKAGWPLQRRFDSGVVDLDWELATTDEFIDTVERREQRADSRAVARIFLPRAIAVIGASDRIGSAGNLLWSNVRASVRAPVYPVNPRLEDLDGVHCFRSVQDLPEEVSLAIIAVPSHSLESTIDACINKRMRGAVIVTSPDSVDGSEQFDLASLVRRSRRNGLRLIGPSSMGIASLRPDSQLQAALVDVALPSGGVAISMQSGSLGASLLRRARDLDLGLSWFVSLGDKSDVSANDLLQFWEDDQFTRVIGLYTETFGNPRKFARIARRVGRTKPIVAVRTGAAADGPLGGALYQQAGLIEVPTVHALLDTCRVLEAQPVLRGPRVAVITNSASPGILAQAALTTTGLTPRTIEPTLNWRSGPDDYRSAIDTAVADDNIDGLLVIFAPPVPAFEAAMGPVIAAAAANVSKPVVAVMIGSGDGWVADGASVPSFAFPEQAVATLASSYTYGCWLTTEATLATDEPRTVDPGRAHNIVRDWLERPQVDPGVGVHLDIPATADLLSAYGIPVATAQPATPDTAGGAAEQIGFPVAVKSTIRTAGRSARAGVALDLNSAHEVDDAVATMLDALGDEAGTFVVQEMTSPGVDVRIHCQRYERLGVIVNVGYGGFDADLIGDRTSRLAPLSPASASAMLGETKVGGAIAMAGLDSSPLVDVIVLAAQLCDDQRDIDDLDLNPVIVSDSQTLVTDAQVRLVDRPNNDGPIRHLG
ncbi:MAG: GNAT family N-acetyltransferase [Ilumatobacter sp.]|nr:GNAT family N-acetyltransferase [Ilumatobacter sp.]